MSVWTYVTAVFEGVDNDVETEVLGKTVQFDSPLELWEEFGKHKERFVPTGSEGSLEIARSRKYHEITATGALRDYMNETALIDWTRKGFYDLHARKATIVIECVGRTTVTFEK